MGRVLTAVFLLYAAITLGVTLLHEPWRDEADPWLLMRDGTLADIAGGTSYRGTPLLWYLAVWPFAAAGAPYLAQQLLHLAIAWAAVLLLFRSPAFPPLVKALFALSYYASFEYAAIARPYALVMLLSFLMAAQWRTREEKPLRLAITVALLANTAMHGLVIAAVAGMLLVIERISRERRASPPNEGGRTESPALQGVTATAIMLAGGLLAVAQLWPRPGGQIVTYLAQAETVWYTLATAFFPDLRLEPAAVCALIVLGLVTLAIARYAVPLLFLWESLALLMAIFVFVWMGGTRHAGLVLIVTIAAVWIADAYGPFRHERLAMAALAVSLAWSVVPAARAWSAETRLAYSGGRELAEYLERNGLEQVELAAGAQMWNTPLVDLPETRVWFAARREYGSYSKWDRAEAGVTAETAIRNAQEHFRGRRWLLVLRSEVPKAFERDFRLVYRTRQEVWGHPDERFWLYEPAE